jgi:hypothetical protein
MGANMATNTKHQLNRERDPPANPELELKAALDAFERSLETPIVSGELSPWLVDVQKTCSEAAAQTHFHTKHLHARQYEEIAKQDPELLPRLDLLKAEDTAIEQERDQLNQTMARIAQHAANFEPDEEKSHKFTKSLIDDGLAFVARVRKQSVAVQTWYIEAFDRDRGSVD